VVERGSDKHGPRTDDALEREMEDDLRAGHATRSEPWRQPDAELPDDEEAAELGLDGPMRSELRDDRAR
jgi:hypothetical protein